MKTRADIINDVTQERARQLTLAGSEWDGSKTPNDWVATIVAYLGDISRRNGSIPDAEEFQTTMIQIAAIAVAAVEHVDMMKDEKKLR